MATPLTPVALVPWGGQSIVTTTSNNFTWQSDGTQTAFYIEYAHNIAGASVSNTGWQTSSLSQYAFTSGVFINTWEYKWRVKIRNSSGLESAYSDWAVFRAGNASALTITFPANDLDVLSALPVYQHVYNSPNGYYQVAYEYKLFTGTTWNDFDALTAAQQESYTWDELECLATGTELWDSGKVTSTATSVEQPSEYLQILQYWYKVQCTIWDNADNEVISDIRTFGLLVDSIPKTPTIIATSDPDNGRNIITITNPTPDVGQIAVSYNRLYRRKLDGTWELVDDNITDGYGYDTTCRSSKQEEYAASAVGTNEIEGSKSASAYATCELTSYWFTNLTTNSTVEIEAEVKFGRMISERERAESIGMDEQYPSVAYGVRRFYRGNFQALLLKPIDGTTWPVYCQQIVDVLDATTYAPVMLRSPYGDLLEVNIYDLKIAPSSRVDQARVISFSMMELAEMVPASGFTYDTPPTNIDNYWVINPNTGLGFELKASPSWDGISIERDRTEYIGFSSEMGTPNYGNKKAVRSGFSGMVLKPNARTLPEEVMRLRELVDSQDKVPLWFKTPAGDEFLVDTYNFSYELYGRMDQARKIAFEFVEVGVVT